MNKEIHIVCKIKCRVQDHDQVHKILLEYVNPSRKEEGCLYYDIFENKHDLGEFLIIDGWKNQEAIDHHVQQSHVIETNKILEPYLLQKQELTWLNKISD